MKAITRIAVPVASALLALSPMSTVSAATPVVAVFSKTLNGYERHLGADNKFDPETYAFAAGGRLDGPLDDPSLGYLKFSQIAGVIAASLKREGYIGSTDPKTTKLLIFVYWGATTGWDSNDSLSSLGSAVRTAANAPQINAPGAASTGLVNTQMIVNESANLELDKALDLIAFSNVVRDQNNEFNASILGYTKARNETNFMRAYSSTARDILADVEESRYFVVLKAYDFQKLRSEKKKVQLWETRYSIPKHGARFDEQLVDMTRFASQFYGENVDRLIRRHLREGRVDVGTPVEVTPASLKK